MMDDSSVLIWGTFFGGIGIGYLIYGKKQKNPLAFLTGVSLFAIPYLVVDINQLVAACVAVILLPFFIRV